MFKIIKKLQIYNLIPRCFSTWFSIHSLYLLLNNNYYTIEYMQNSNIYIYIILFILFFSIYTILNNIIKKFHTDSFGILLSYTICTIIWLKNYNNIQQNFLFLLSIIVLYSIIIVYFVNKNKDKLKKIQLNKKILQSFTVLIPVIILIAISCLRYYNFQSPNFDLGIFSNIFYNMKNSFLPLSTCERDMLLSHFAVHFSPILYLILPIYFLFSHPITLQIIQVLIVFSGIIPLIKISKHYNLSKNKIIIISILYCFYPALSGGCLFDFHENCFLPVFLLWLFYFFEQNKTIPMFIMSLLTLLIKEDAAIYIVIFSLYIIISRKYYKKGAILLISSIFYFLLITFLLNKYGLGVMSDRYDNLIYNDNGLISAIKTIILNPGYVLTQTLSTTYNNYDKIIYILNLLLPLAFLPIITRKASRLILIVPILLNLITNYIYQYDITFHYSFGIIAFLFYASIQNLADIKTNTTTILSLAFMSCFCIYYSYIITTFNNNLNIWNQNKNQYTKIVNIFKKIPKEASVSASTFFIPHLSNRNTIYEIYYHENKTDIDYIILDMRYENNIETINYYKNNNYEIILEEKNLITILKTQKS